MAFKSVLAIAVFIMHSSPFPDASLYVLGQVQVLLGL